MRRIVLTLLAALSFAACQKSITIDHHICAEFPLQEVPESISVLFADNGQADILIGSDGVIKSIPEGAEASVLPGGEQLLRYKSLALVWGDCADTEEFLESYYWISSALQWILYLNADPEQLYRCGFVNCFRARGIGINESDVVLYAGSNVYDKISGLGATPVSFTVNVKEEVR